MQNLREREIQLVSKMLTLTNTGSAVSSVDFNDQWKVLIYDQDCRDIISPLMNIGALRQKGVTLHMLINTEREAVPDAPAVYFVRPTEANIKRIAEDCAKQLYRTVFLNFVTRIERPLLEKLAQELVATNSVSMVSKIYDQYLDVISLEPQLFTLNIKDSFMLYNESSLGEAQIRKFMSRVTSGLLSMVRVLGSLPIIRCPPGGAAEMLAQDLNSVLRENISGKGPAISLFEDCLVNDRSRPLLLIVDRACDLFPMLQHNSTYQPLISDLLDCKLNRVTVELPEKDGQRQKKTYDLNTAVDSFLHKYAGSLFPDVAEATDRELAATKVAEAALRSRPHQMQDSSSSSSIEAKGRDLGEALESLPELLNKKANLEAHTNIMNALLGQIKKRAVADFFGVEQAMLTAGGRLDRASILAFLKDPTKGNIQDKARLLALSVVSGDAASSSKAANDELDAAFAEGCNAMPSAPSGDLQVRYIAAVNFLRRLLSLQYSPGGAGGAASAAAGVGGQGGAIFSSLINNVVNKATQMFQKFTPYYVTRVVESLAEGRACPEAESFCLLDPKARETVAPAASAVGTKYSDVIVFVVGGGSYPEFFNLQELLKNKPAGSQLRNIMYGCSDLINGEEFLSQLERLAAPAGASSAAAAGK